jgi:hypothetical protein
MPLVGLLTPAQAATTSMIRLNESEFQLFVFPAAPNLPADSGSYHVLVQLQTAHDDKPFESPSDFELKLVSSDPSVIIIPQDLITFKAGETMVKAEIMTTNKAGIASITALTEGAASHTATVNTMRMDSLEPTRLALYAAPASFIPDPKFTGLVYIQLLNSQNLPAVSTFDTAIDLSSSQATVGSIPSYAVIPAGSSGVLIEFKPQKNIGETTLKASAPGLAPAQLSVDVTGPVAQRISVEFAPNILPAVNYHDAMMSVQLVDGDNNPVRASSNVRITLRSSDTSISSVPQYVDISAGNSYTIVPVTAKGTQGTATITASATGYETGLREITAVPLSNATLNDAKVLKVFSVPSILPPDGLEHQSIVIAFQDNNGNPYRQSSYLYSRIALSTSNTQVGDISSTSFVAKETYAIGKFKTRFAIGETVLTASLQGYQPGQGTLTVDGSGPAAIALAQLPGVIEANGISSNSLVVSLVGHNGEPVAAQQDMTVYLSSSNTDIAKVQASVLVRAGKDHAVSEVVTTQRAGQAIVSGASDGLASGSVTFKTVGFSGSISEYHLGVFSIGKLPADGKEYEAIVVQLQDQNGLPVLAKSDTDVSLSSSSFLGGTVQEKVVIKAGASLTTAVFRASLQVDDGFKITASGQGFNSVDSELETTSQPLTIIRTEAYPTRGNFEDEIVLSADVYSGAIPIGNAALTITGINARDNVIMTDENGHAEGKYIPTLPGTNSIIVKANKPGFAEASVSSRIILDQSVNFIIGAQTQAGNEFTSQFKVATTGNPKPQTAKPGAPITYENAKWGAYTITAPEEVKTANAIYKFTSWSDGLTENPRTFSIFEDTEIKAVYEAKYLLQITDANGLSRGGGYYDEGSVATITMSQNTVGGVLIDKTFEGWTGDLKSSSLSASIIMDGPKNVIAIWSDSYLKIVLIIAAVSGGGFFYYWKIFRPKKELQEKQRAPDLDWYKS